MQSRSTVAGVFAALMCAACVFQIGPTDDAGAHSGQGGGWAGGGWAGGGWAGGGWTGGGWTGGGRAGGGWTGGGWGQTCMEEGGSVADGGDGGGGTGDGGGGTGDGGGGTGDGGARVGWDGGAWVGWDGGYGIPVCDHFSVVSGAAEPAFRCGCTRRPGPGASALFCPTGSDVSVSAVIGPDGGTVVLTGTPSTTGSGSFQVELRRHALDSDVTVRLTETSVPPPRGIIDASPMFFIEPANLVLHTPAVVSVPWSGRSGPINPMTIFMSTDDPCTLAPLTDAYWSLGSTSRFGWVVIGSPRDDCTALCP